MYEGKCSLWNTRSVGEIYTAGLTDNPGRAPCPTTLWLHEQKEGKKSYEQLIDLEVHFNGTLYRSFHPKNPQKSPKPP